MAKDFSRMEDSNDSLNRSIHEVSDPGRRTVLRGGLGALIGGLFAPLAVGSLSACATVGAGNTSLGFKSVPLSTADTISVPEGYSYQVIAPWGEAVGVSGENPAFKMDASNTAAEQEVQLGMHHDGIHFFSQEGSTSGLLVMNHEYSDDGLLHPDGMTTWTAQKVRKAQAAHGVSVIEVEQKGGQWQMVKPSPWARRITANTPMVFAGPAAGHAMLKTTAPAASRPGAPT
jgi:uncharacterized protein